MLPLILCIAISGCNKKQITEETETKTKKTQITTTEYQKTRKISKSMNNLGLIDPSVRHG